VNIIIQQKLANFFPKGQFGDGCLNIHPHIPCKFGYYCSRMGCSYSHPIAPSYPAQQFPGAMPGMPSYMGMGPKFKNMKLEHHKSEENSKEPSLDNTQKVETNEQSQVNKPAYALPKKTL